MKIYVCDRCGEKIDCLLEPSKRTITVRIKSISSLNDKRNYGVPMELCDKCYRELVIWLHKEDN